MKYGGVWAGVLALVMLWGANLTHKQARMAAPARAAFNAAMAEDVAARARVQLLTTDGLASDTERAQAAAAVSVAQVMVGQRYQELRAAQVSQAWALSLGWRLIIGGAIAGAALMVANVVLVWRQERRAKVQAAAA